VVEGRVEEVQASDLWSRSDVPTVLTGGPPCQPFSSAGAQRGLDDPRGHLFAEFVRLADALKPRFILFENVRGLITQRGPNGLPGEALNMVRDSFEQAGYATTFRLIRCADYGLPQRRVRLFMFGARKQDLPAWPNPTHSKYVRTSSEPLFGELKPWVPLRDFMDGRSSPDEANFIRPSQELQRLLASVPVGKGLKSPGRAEPTRPGGHWGYKQGTFIADPDLPARTVTAASTQDWWRMPDGSLRRLTETECAGLQGFPSNWEFVGSRVSRYRQIGNAVPAPIARLLAESIADASNSAARSQRVSSAPFPDEFGAAIAYTARDARRNASARVRLDRRPT
jgi:DNA (cytosine-5)-methyltransferase 1